MLIMTADRMKVCSWGTGENIRIEDWTRDEREGCHAVYIGSQSTTIFRGTEEECKAVLHLIFMAHSAITNFIVPTPEELAQDDLAIKLTIACEERAQRISERNMAGEIMADAWLKENDPMGVTG